MADPFDKYFLDLEDTVASGATDLSLLDDDLRAVVSSDPNASWFSDSVGQAMRDSAERALKSPGDGLTPSQRFLQDLAEIALEHPRLLLLQDAYSRGTAFRSVVDVATGWKDPIPYRQITSSAATVGQDQKGKTPTNGLCAHCATPASSSCGGCKDAPNLLDQTLYCNTNCQRADRSRHKSLCNRMQQRALLYRAASILKELFYLLRISTFQHDVDRVEERHGILYICTTDERARDKLFPFGPLPSQRIKREDVKQALLVVHYCQEHLRDSYLLIKAFLEGSYVEIQEVHLRVKNARRPTALVRPDGRVHNNMFHQHSVLRVTLRSGEKYCVHATGAQFGFGECVMPWDEYLMDRVMTIRSTQPFGTQYESEVKMARSQDRSWNASLLFGTVGYVLATGALDWAQTKEGMDLKKMLKLPSAHFNEKRGQLIAFANALLVRYVQLLQKDNKWTMVMQDGVACLKLSPDFTQAPSYSLMRKFAESISR